MAIFSKSAKDSLLSDFSEDTQTFIKTQVFPRLIELDGWTCPVSNKTFSFKLKEAKTLGEICENCTYYLMYLLHGCVRILNALKDFDSRVFGDLSHLLKLYSIYYNLFISFQLLQHKDGLFTGIDSYIIKCLYASKDELINTALTLCDTVKWQKEDVDDMRAFKELFMITYQQQFLEIDYADPALLKETAFV